MTTANSSDCSVTHLNLYTLQRSKRQTRSRLQKASQTPVHISIKSVSNPTHKAVNIQEIIPETFYSGLLCLTRILCTPFWSPLHSDSLSLILSLSLTHKHSLHHLFRMSRRVATRCCYGDERSLLAVQSAVLFSV